MPSYWARYAPNGPKNSSKTMYSSVPGLKHPPRQLARRSVDRPPRRSPCRVAILSHSSLDAGLWGFKQETDGIKTRTMMEDLAGNEQKGKNRVCEETRGFGRQTCPTTADQKLSVSPNGGAHS